RGTGARSTAAWCGSKVIGVEDAARITPLISKTGSPFDDRRDFREEIVRTIHLRLHFRRSGFAGRALRACLLGAVGATFFASPDAPAAVRSTGAVTTTSAIPITRPVPVIPIVVPTAPVCPSPSVSVCQAESGKTDSCATSNHAACVTILKN